MLADSDSSGARKKAEDRFEKARRTTETARTLMDADLQAVRSKTARLKALRLQTEAAETPVASKKPAPKKRKTGRRG